MSKTYTGTAAGPGMKFYACVEYKTTTQEEARAYVQRRFFIKVTGSGSFGGTYITTSWGNNGAVYGAGNYLYSGWSNVGWVNYGSTTKGSGSAHYTGYSGTYYSSSVSATYSPDVPTWVPKDVSNVSGKRNSDTSLSVSWTNNPTAARPYTGIYVDRSVDGGDYSLRMDCTATQTTFVDATGVSANHFYRYRVLPHNSKGNAPNHQYTAVLYTTPAAPRSCASARASDTSNTVTWVHGSSNSGLYSGHKIERQVDGGSWTQIATVGATATSYTDSTASANHYYRYRVRSYNGAGNSGYATSGTTYNTPAAPGKPTVARTSDTGIQGTFTNGANTATALEVQRSTDRSTWVSVGTVEGRATSFADNPGGGTFYYRIRNTRGSMASAWVMSDAVVTICAPAAPTVTAPASSVVVPKTQATVAVRWNHNPIDGSAQTSAQVRWSTDGGSTWQTATVPGATASHSLSNSFAVNSTVAVQVRTKGAHADYGPWSASRMFFVYQVPTVTVEEPANGFLVENMPIHVKVAYSDPSGTLAEARMAVTRDGSTVYERTITGQLEFDIGVNDWIPESGARYRVEVSVRSSSTLQASADRAFDVEFQPPSLAIVDAVPDPDTGYVTVTVHGIADGQQEIDRCSLFRVVGGVTTLLADGLADGDSYLDKYAPLNTDFSYMTASYAASGAVQQGTYPGRVDSKWAFLYWGEDGIARAFMDVNDAFDVRPGYELVSIAGSEFPVVVMSDETDEPHSLSGTVRGRGEAMRFYEYARSHLPCVYKSAYGFVMRAVASPRLSQPNAVSDLWAVSLDLTRIGGDPL